MRKGILDIPSGKSEMRNLLNMLPAATAKNVANVSLATVKRCRDFFNFSALGPHCPHLPYSVRSESRLVRAFDCEHTPFGITVGGVVLLSTKKQMLRSDARRVIASVQYAKPVKDWAVVNLPREAMRADRCIADAHCTVRSAGLASPDPARAKFRANRGAVLVHALPETLNGRRLTAIGRAGVTAICAAACSLKLPRPAKEWDSAELAYTIWNSHDLNLRHRFENWLDPFGCISIRSGRLVF